MSGVGNGAPVGETRQTAWAVAVAACPKHMQHGPCAGVHPDGRCEITDVGACSYLDLPPPTWPFPRHASPSAAPTNGLFAVARTRAITVADLPAAHLSAGSLSECAAVLAGATDAVLIGDHGGARVQFPPSYRARLVADAGGAAWVGINCRDRNRVALEGEVAASVDAGAVGVHCVTGDHPQSGHRPDALPVFDLDSVDVVALADAYTGKTGIAVSVAHAPISPPAAIRLPRLLAKVAAGASAVFIDHCGGRPAVATAVAELRDHGFAGLVIACVPVVFDHGSALVLESFAGDRLPPGLVARILGARDPGRAGEDAAVDYAAELLAVPGIDGVNLSGGAAAGAELASARRMAATSARIRELAIAARPTALSTR
jgi:5,10-methylenetetrahydrofolate reductase